MMGQPEEHPMRPILSALVLAALPLAAGAEPAMCEYRHPAHPNWDFFASCTVEETAAGSVTTREVTVSNGSRLTTRDGPDGASVNGLAAERVTREAAQCWRTLAEDELICIYPEGTAAPEPGRPAMALAITPGAPGSAFGGGVSGQCLLVEGTRVVEQGACTRRENCLEAEAGGGQSCLVSHDWASGRSTELASASGWTTLDGAPAVSGDPGCLIDSEADVTFCWSRSAITAETNPVLARAMAAMAPAAAAPEGESGTAAPAAE